MSSGGCSKNRAPCKTEIKTLDAEYDEGDHFLLAIRVTKSELLEVSFIGK